MTRLGEKSGIPIKKVCAIAFCLQSYLHSWGYHNASSPQTGLQIIFVCFIGNKMFELFFHLPSLSPLIHYDSPLGKLDLQCGSKKL